MRMAELRVHASVEATAFGCKPEQDNHITRDTVPVYSYMTGLCLLPPSKNIDKAKTFPSACVSAS